MEFIYLNICFILYNEWDIMTIYIRIKYHEPT